MAAHTVYVNGTDNAGAWMFTGLQAAISYMATNYPNLTSNNGSGAAGPLNIEISITTSDTTQAVVNGFTTSAANYVHIYTTDATRNKTGKWSTSHYRLEAANVTGALWIYDEYVRVTGLQIRLSSANANAQAAVAWGGVATSVQYFSQNLVHTPHDGTYRTFGLYVSDSDITLYAFNNIVDERGEANNSISCAAYIQNCTNCYFYNCTLLGTYAGISRSAGTVTAKNTYCSGGTDGFVGTISTSYCASSLNADLSGTGDITTATALDNNNFVDATNATPLSRDYHIAVGTGSALYDTGDAPGGSAPLDYTTDIDGETVTTWCIGADSRAGGGSSPIPVFMYHYLHH